MTKGGFVHFVPRAAQLMPPFRTGWCWMEKLSANRILCLRHTLKRKNPVKLAVVKLNRFTAPWLGTKTTSCVVATPLPFCLWLKWPNDEKQKLRLFQNETKPVEQLIE
jgi:hypothetical protein